MPLVADEGNPLDRWFSGSTYLLKRKRAAQEALALSSNSIPSP